jgi:hypothetical protein
MPTAPLFYQPLVQARVLATPIGDTTVFDAQKVQAELTQENYKKFGPAMDGILRGFENLQGGMPGSKTLDVIQFSYDDSGYLANRVATTMRLHPEMFDAASPDQAAEMGAKLVEEANKELATNPGMRAVGDTLEVAPDVTHILRKHWEGAEPLHAEEAAYLGVTASRELQRAVTPLAPDATHPQLQWIEDATAWKLGMWQGAASSTIKALGVKADAAEVEKVVDGWRTNMQAVEPKVVGPLDSLTRLLAVAGVKGTDDASRIAAYQMLQGTPLDGVPAGMASAIVGAQQLPADKAGYIGGRIVETGGSQGNITGLLAELELMKRPPGTPPPGNPPPGGEEPPPPGPPSEPPPGGEPPPPVQPPKGEEPPAPPKGDEPPKGEEPPPVNPPKGDEPPAPKSMEDLSPREQEILGSMITSVEQVQDPAVFDELVAKARTQAAEEAAAGGGAPASDAPADGEKMTIEDLAAFTQLQAPPA